MIAFAACVADEAKYRRYAVTGLRQAAEPNSLIVETSTTTSIFEAYNEVLDALAGRDDLEALVLLHEDTEIVDAEFCAKVRAHLADPDVAVLGVAGACEVTELKWWRGEKRGRVRESRGLMDFGGGEHDVDAVDGLMLVLSPWAVRNLRFDAERFTGFHAYDVDFCFQARAAGKRVRVADLSVMHHTKGGFGDEAAFDRADAIWREKWIEPAAPAPAPAPTPPAADVEPTITVTRPPDANPAPRISVVLCAYGNRALTERCLEAFMADAGAQLGGEVELVLVDNGSLDDTAELFRSWSDRATVVTVTPNRNYSGGNNAGARAARGEAIVFLSNDVLLAPGAVATLGGQALEPGVGAVGARLLYPDGALQHAGVALVSGGRLPLPGHLFHYQAGDLPAAGITVDLECVTAACFAAPRAAFLAAGGFDEGYANGWEDVDLCMKLRREGLRVILRGDVVLVHDEGRTRGRNNDETANGRLFYSRWADVLEPDDELIAEIWDARFEMAARPAPQGPPAELVIIGQPAGLAPEADEARALLAACEELGIATAAFDEPARFVAPRLEPHEQALLERAWNRPVVGDVVALQVPVGMQPLPEPAPGAFVRLACVPERAPVAAAAVWAASPAGADGLIAAGVPAERVAWVPPAIPELAAGPGGAGVLALLPAHDLAMCRTILAALAAAPAAGAVRLLPSAATQAVAALAGALLPAAELLGPCSSEARYSALAAGADLVLAGDPSDRFERRALIAAACGAAVVTLAADGPAAAVGAADAHPAAARADALAAAIAEAAASRRARAERSATVLAACGPAATRRRLRELFGITGAAERRAAA